MDVAGARFLTTTTAVPLVIGCHTFSVLAQSGHLYLAHR